MTNETVAGVQGLSVFFKKNAVRLILIFLVIFGFRLGYSTAPVIDSDEATYLVVAQDFVRGGILYQNAWEHKGPFLYLIFSVIIKIFGNDIFAFRIVTTFYLLMTTFFVYRLMREIFVAEISLITAFFYGIFFCYHGGPASNAELFMMLPAVLAIYFFALSRRDDRPSTSRLFLCGVFSSIAVFIKLTAFFTVMICPFALVLKKMIAPRYSYRDFFGDLKIYLFGAIIPILPVFIYFICYQRLGDFLWTYFVFNYHYATALPLGQALRDWFLFFVWPWWAGPLNFVLYASAAVVAWKWKSIKKFDLVMLVCFFFFSLLGVVSARNCYPHYYLQMALPFSFLLGFALLSLNITRKVLRVLIHVGLIILLLGAYHPARIKHFYGEFLGRKHWVEHQIAEYVYTHSLSSDRIFIERGEPIIYFLSQRLAPTRYFFWIYYTDPHESILRIREKTKEFFLSRPPRFIIHGSDTYRLSPFICDKDFLDGRYTLKKELHDYKIYERDEAVYPFDQ